MRLPRFGPDTHCALGQSRRPLPLLNHTKFAALHSSSRCCLPSLALSSATQRQREDTVRHQETHGRQGSGRGRITAAHIQQSFKIEAKKLQAGRHGKFIPANSFVASISRLCSMNIDSRTLDTFHQYVVRNVWCLMDESSRHPSSGCILVQFCFWYLSGVGNLVQ